MVSKLSSTTSRTRCGERKTLSWLGIGVTVFLWRATESMFCWVPLNTVAQYFLMNSEQWEGFIKKKEERVELFNTCDQISISRLYHNLSVTHFPSKFLDNYCPKTGLSKNVIHTMYVGFTTYYNNLP